jgi:predicted kinase
MRNLILLRGNSGCGKSTIANALQRKIGSGTLLISQDYVRREMLMVKDRPDNPAVNLLMNLIEYGYKNCEFSILEGILYSDIYERLFIMAKDLYEKQIFAYYFDISFEETLRRHKLKLNSHEFGESEMKRWWRDNDLLLNIHENIIDITMNIDETVEHITKCINI